MRKRKNLLLPKSHNHKNQHSHLGLAILVMLIALLQVIMWYALLTPYSIKWVAPKPQELGITIKVVSEDPPTLQDKIDIAFMEDAHVAKAIAMCESRMRADRIGDAHLTFVKDGIEYGKSYGVFQIRYLPGRPTPDKLLDEDFNVQYAKAIYEKQGWQPWTCKSHYQKFL